jgi:ParB family chromosome partitioning protein
MGAIDLDPASTAIANTVVGAATFYTHEQDGLSRPWRGRVWLNPPYAQPAIEHFARKLAEEYAAGHVSQAVVLVNNASETAWFQTLGQAASALCQPTGRVRFWHPGKESATPLQGQSVLYLGTEAERFAERFVFFGLVWRRA